MRACVLNVCLYKSVYAYLSVSACAHLFIYLAIYAFSYTTSGSLGMRTTFLLKISSFSMNRSLQVQIKNSKGSSVTFKKYMNSYGCKILSALLTHNIIYPLHAQTPLMLWMWREIHHSQKTIWEKKKSNKPVVACDTF